MLETCEVISSLPLHAIKHVDNSARVQTVHEECNPMLTGLITEFYNITGCPILLNTSFNIKNEPIVCSPYDAIGCFVIAQLDVLVIGDYFVDRNENDLEVIELMLKASYEQLPGINYNVYSFL
jgi:carbamoyltransferase